MWSSYDDLLVIGQQVGQGRFLLAAEISTAKVNLIQEFDEYDV